MQPRTGVGREKMFTVGHVQSAPSNLSSTPFGKTAFLPPKSPKISAALGWRKAWPGPAAGPFYQNPHLDGGAKTGWRRHTHPIHISTLPQTRSILQQPFYRYFVILRSTEHTRCLSPPWQPKAVEKPFLIFRPDLVTRGALHIK